MTETLLITGASSDLGGALARSLLDSHPHLRLIAHSHRGGDRIEALKDEFGDRVYPVSADFSDRASVDKLADEIATQFGAPSQIVHLPALSLSYERFTKFDFDHFH